MVATTAHVADLVANVGAERVEVNRLLDPTADPHDYEPRPSDVQAIADAAVVFRSGGEVDAWLDELVSSAGDDATVVTLGDVYDRLEEDPHWWQDPRNAIAVVRRIADELAGADPAGADAYRRNARRYAGRLGAVDRAIDRCFRRVPSEDRKLVTTHDSYGAFADRYEIEVVGTVIPARSTEAQPSAGETAELVERIRAEEVAAIFPESALEPELEQAIAEEAGVPLGDPLWGDSLGPPGSGGATYVEALASDARAMVEGFTGGERSCRAGAA